MKVLKIIGIIVLVIVIIGAGVVIFGPSEVHMEREITIDAPVEVVFSEVNGFKTYDQFSAWSEIDTAALITIEGPAYGAGASYSWQSDNPDLGNGSIEIIESDPNMMVKSKMKFEGFPGEPLVSWILSEEDGSTKVIYTYDWVDINGLWKLFGLATESMLAPMYDQTLEKIKNRIESKPDFTYAIEQVETSAQPYVGASATSSSDPAEIGEAMGDAYGKVMSYLSANRIEVKGAPISININYDEQIAEMICAIPVESILDISESDLVSGSTYSGKALKTVYYGNYDEIGNAHQDINAFISYYMYERNGQPWEEYVTDPMTQPDTSKWETNVYYPVK